MFGTPRRCVPTYRPATGRTANLRISRSTQPEQGSARCSRFFRANLRLHAAMIEKVTLPINLGVLRSEALPTGNNICHLHINREAGEEMNMVRHQKKNGNKPSLLALVELRRLE